MNKKFLGLLLFSSFVSANTPDIITLSGPYAVNKHEAQNSVVNFYLPDNSVATLGLSGGDQFASTVDNSPSISTKKSDNKFTIFINNNQKPGESSVIGVNTVCGLSLSVVIHSIEKVAKAEQIKPKLSITSSACPEIKSAK